MDETEIPQTVSTLETTTQLQHAIENLRHLVGELKAGLYDRATDQERMLHTAAPPVEALAVPAGEKANAHHTPAMLDNTKGVLDVAGYIPQEVILGTSAAKVMLSKKFVEALGINLSTLTPRPESVTAGGSVETTMGQTAAKSEFILSMGTAQELQVTLTALVVDTNAYCALLGTEFITATNGGYDSYTEKFKYRYLAAVGILHSFELSAPCHSVTPPLVAYAFSVGQIYAAVELLDVLGTSEDDVLSYEDDEVLAPSQMAAAQLNRLAVICATMEAKDLREVTTLRDGRRQEDVVIRLKAALVEVLKPADPTSQWVGEIVYNAHPINYAVRNISLISLQCGVHVMENFAGIGLRVLRMTEASGIVVQVCTYVHRDPVSRKIARHVLIQLQQEHSQLILQSAIESFDRMYMPQEISLIGLAALTNLVAHYGLVDILGGSWEC